MEDHATEYPGTKMISYPFYLRKDLPPCRFILPADLTRAELQRIIPFLDALITE